MSVARAFSSLRSAKLLQSVASSSSGRFVPSFGALATRSFHSSLPKANLFGSVRSTSASLLNNSFMARPRVQTGINSMMNLHKQQVRHLNLHEFQSKALMAKYNVRVQKGEKASTPEEAEAVAKRLLAENPKAELVIKSQIHAGGRGKGHFNTGFKGGVKLSTKPSEIKEYARQMLGNKLITSKLVRRVSSCKRC